MLLTSTRAGNAVGHANIPRVPRAGLATAHRPTHEAVAIGVESTTSRDFFPGKQFSLPSRLRKLRR